MDEFRLSLLKKLEEVVDGEKEAQKEEKYVTNCVEFSVEVPDSCLQHYEGPQEGQGHDEVDEVTWEHGPLFLAPHLPKVVCLLEVREDPLKEEDQYNVDG